MKFKNFSYLFIFSGILLLTTCKNKLDINAPYQEIPTIYAVLNPQEAIQMIRINKVFLGEGNANDMAKVADSINYPAGALQVTLERYINGNQVVASTLNNHVVVFHDSIIQSSPGAFSTTQRVYVSYEKLYPSGHYVLKVKHTDGSGKVYTAGADAIDSVNSTIHPLSNGFSPFIPPYYPVPPGSVSPLDPVATANAYIDYSNQNQTYSPKFFPNEGSIYTMVLRFHFYDYVGGDSIPKYAEYTFGNQDKTNLRTIGSTQVFAFDFKGIDLFNSIGYSLSKMNLNTSVSRKMYKMQAIAYSSTQDYVDYLLFTEPSLSIAQEKPIYSNFDNRDALGIFTFRTRHSIYKEMASPFVSAFSYNQYTCNYNFLTAAYVHQGCL